MGHWLVNLHVVSGPQAGWQPSTQSVTHMSEVLLHADELSVYQPDDILEGIFHILHLLYKEKTNKPGNIAHK